MAKDILGKFNGFMHDGGHIYEVSEDNVRLGDYIYDFHRHHLSLDPIQICDNQAFVDLINAYYKRTPFSKRQSAKIIKTNDEKLNKNGVSRL